MILLPRSLRGRILALILFAALLPIVLLSILFLGETQRVVSLWQPTRMGRTLAFSLEAQRALLDGQGRMQGELALSALESGWRGGAAGPAAGDGAGGRPRPEPRELTVEMHPPGDGAGDGRLARVVGERLPPNPPGAEGPEPVYRGWTVSRPDADWLIAGARDDASPNRWALVGREFPPGTFLRFEDLSRDLSFLNRLQEVTAVAGTALVFLIVLVSVIAAAAAILVATWLSRSVTRPVESLARAMTRLGEGEETPDLPARGASEVRVLSESFNRLMEQLSRAQSRLAATERSLGFRDSARQVAHEMRNALTPILSALGVLRPTLEDAGDRPRQALQLLEGEAGRLEKLASGFAQMARLPPPDPKAVDALASLRRIMHLHLPASVSYEEGAVAPPLQSGEIRVMVDPDALDQVWVNLARNAAEAMGDGGRVTVSAWIEDDDGPPRLHLTVTDTGPGPPGGKSIAHFHPGKTTKPEGSGLGLYTSQLLVRAAGGNLVLEAADDGGARAHVTFPIEGPHAAPVAAGPIERAADNPPEGGPDGQESDAARR